MAKSKAAELAEVLTTPVPRIPAIPTEDFLSTGCTLMDLAFSGRPRCGVPKGTYLYLVGDSGSGKTWFTFNLFAEAARNPHFKDYRFVFDNAENGALMDVERFFGKGVVERLEPPMWAETGTGRNKKQTPVYSSSVETFYKHLDINCRTPCIYVLDSMDAINADTEDDKFAAEVAIYETGRGKAPGSMGMEKAKVNSKNINRVVQALRPTGSILVVISQTRDKVGGIFPGQKTRAGGHSLKFFAHLEAWLSIRKPLTRRYLGKEREVGTRLKIDVTKNRVCGWEGKFEIEFLKGYGVDDVGSTVEFLVEEKYWAAQGKGKSADRTDDTDGKVITAPEFDFFGPKDELVERIQSAGDEWELQRLVAAHWADIIDKAAPPRKPRYT
jgi:RecA/RadA recombinase